MTKQGRYATVFAIFAALPAVMFLYWTAYGVAQEMPVGPCNSYRLDYRALVNIITEKEIQVTEDTVEPVTKALVACAESRLTKQQLSVYRQAQDNFERKKSNANDELELGLLDIELAYAISKDPVIDELRPMVWQLSSGPLKQTIAQIAVKRNAAKILKINGWIVPATFDFLERKRTEYLANCRSAGIPIPPPLGVQGSALEQWSTEMDLDNSKFFLLTGWRAKLWTYKSKSGFCIAMARLKGSNPMLKATGQTNKIFDDEFVGTICTDSAQDKACFFDNLVYDKNGNPSPLSLADTLTTKYEDLVHPDSLVNKCVQCHIGQNPFVINPNSDLGMNVKKMYQSLSAEHVFEVVDFGTDKIDQWKNPPKVNVGGKLAEDQPGACMRCHVIAQKTGNHSKFCSAILAQSARFTMPPSGPPAGWLDPPPHGKPPRETNKHYADSIKLLKAMCSSK